MGRDGVLFSLFVTAALGVWTVMASRTRHRMPHEPTDHEVRIVSHGDPEEGPLAAMCTRCEWNDLSTESDTSAQEHDLRAKAKRHSRNVGSSILVVDPEVAEAGWDPDRYYTYPTVVSHGERRWQARWLNRGEEPGVSEAWEEASC
ncbi:MAG TPA: hypothetical protein VFC19_43325 [Candidatus Limnocylindrales bacterium]|nr:hypothetical protein [Candidatus Limnocylindrales bacterium]